MSRERAEPELRVFDDPSQLASAVADAFVQDAREAIRDRGEFNVALAGGSTPKAAYQLLSAEPRRDMVDWPRVNVFFGDERTVPPGSSDSNYKMANDALLSRVPLVADHIHRMRGEDDPITSARDYSQVLTQQLGPLPRFDLVLLGMGPDGHTASLFPGQPTLQETRRWAVAVVGAKSEPRVSLAYPALNSSHDVAFLVTGEGKRDVVARALAGDRTLPAAMIHPVWRLHWFMDRAASPEGANSCP